MLVFFLSEFISPHRSSRIALVAAAAVEAAISAYAGFFWFNLFGFR